jgi:hypothetical protein
MEITKLAACDDDYFLNLMAVKRAFKIKLPSIRDIETKEQKGDPSE